VQDERLQIEQYGQKAELRFVVIDNMISNGFESWLWDGWAESGGWAPDGKTIVQVRSAYTDGPIKALKLARPGPAREEFLAQITRNAPAELTVLAKDGIGPLRATSDRLRLQAIDEVGVRTGAADDAFLAEFWRANIQHSIIIHEGRHVLDKAKPPELSQSELEYRAKLSELALADYPRLALSGISGTQAGDDTPHSQANARVLTGLRNWMQAHKSEIPGFDPATPVLSQLTLLTNKQISAIARSLDPAAH
jgi:hypothetical protein